jgi:hypothetical protein
MIVTIMQFIGGWGTGHGADPAATGPRGCRSATVNDAVMASVNSPNWVARTIE